MEIQWNRLSALAKIRLNQRFRSSSVWILGFLLICTIILFGALLDFGSKNNPQKILTTFHNFFLIAIVMAGVAKWASHSFMELRSPKQIYSGFMLPASNLEKWFFEVVYSLPIWTGISVVVYLIYAQGINYLLSEIVGFEFEGYKIANLTQELRAGNFGFLKNLLLIQSICLLGSTFFKKRVMVKTLLISTLIYGMGLILISIIMESLYGEVSFLYFTEAIGYILKNNNLRMNSFPIFAFMITGILFPAVLYYWAFVRVKKMHL